ncbi:DUF2970 domain-containing protein [Limnohabitans sp. Rim8]|jgi:hypothetical protein|uniref:DUF2970 domain-containing protein n=1 Tax=Limnohabitans sp. Rim8 TaxID=1100718 RepID=UPI0025F15C79|nr:DUF2970 domain-containing protein [Limnohabitans sp. Rim8]
MQTLHTLKTVLWSFIGIGGGRKQGEDFQTNPLVLIAIGLTLLLIFVGILVIIAKAMVAAN